jgi:hypothetical protein
MYDDDDDGDCVVGVEVEVGGEEMKSRLVLDEPPIRSSDMRMQSFTEDAS